MSLFCIKHKNQLKLDEEKLLLWKIYLSFISDF